MESRPSPSHSHPPPPASQDSHFHPTAQPLQPASNSAAAEQQPLASQPHPTGGTYPMHLSPPTPHQEPLVSSFSEWTTSPPDCELPPMLNLQLTDNEQHHSQQQQLSPMQQPVHPQQQSSWQHGVPHHENPQPFLIYSYTDPNTGKVWPLAVPTTSSDPDQPVMQNMQIHQTSTQKAGMQSAYPFGFPSQTSPNLHQSTHRTHTLSMSPPHPVPYVQMPYQTVQPVQPGQLVTVAQPLSPQLIHAGQPFLTTQSPNVLYPGYATQYPPPNVHDYPPPTNQPHSTPAPVSHQATQPTMLQYAMPNQQPMRQEYHAQIQQASPAQGIPPGIHGGAFSPEPRIPSIGPSSGPSLYGLSLAHSSSNCELQTLSSAMWLLPQQARAMSANAPRLSNAPATDVKLEISAKNLVNRDAFSKSDPVAVVFEKVPTPSAAKNAIEVNGASWVEVGRTERLKDNLNPHFRQHVSVPFYFEELQQMRIALWDVDGKSSETSKHDFLGEVYVTLGELVSSGKWSGALGVSTKRDTRLTQAARKKGLGTLTVHAHEGRNTQKVAVDIVLRGRNLSKMDLFGKSDPYVVISRQNGKEGSNDLLFKSEVVWKTLDPVWRPMHFRVEVPQGCRKEDVCLNFEVFDKDQFSRDSEIGSEEATLGVLESRPRLNLVNAKNRSKGKSKSSGTLIVDLCSSMILPSFIDYLQGGLRLNFTVAVDLTQSNGDPRKPDSLHYRHSATGSNGYLKALTAVWNVIEPYFFEGSAVGAFGFGADINRTGSTSHCFNLGLGPSPWHRSLDEVVASYSRTLEQVRLYGPTNFAPVLRQAMEHSKRHRQSQESMNYDILLILTDGCVTDFDATVDALIDASMTCALSVVIIGIGNEDFSKMEELDSDKELLVSRTDSERRARRDIVQFVPYRRFEKGMPEQLAAHVLAEIPDNIVEYFIALSPPVLPSKRIRSSASSISSSVQGF